jgi:hypothetical protein
VECVETGSDPREIPRPAGESAGLRNDARQSATKAHDLRGDAILKMIFNFNFKDMLSAPGPSIRRLTTTCDFNHMVEMLY